VNRGAVAKLREADPDERPAKPEPEKTLCPIDPLACPPLACPPR